MEKIITVPQFYTGGFPSITSFNSNIPIYGNYVWTNSFYIINSATNITTYYADSGYFVAKIWAGNRPDLAEVSYFGTGTYSITYSDGRIVSGGNIVTTNRDSLLTYRNYEAAPIYIDYNGGGVAYTESKITIRDVFNKAKSLLGITGDTFYWSYTQVEVNKLSGINILSSPTDRNSTFPANYGNFNTSSFGVYSIGAGEITPITIPIIYIGVNSTLSGPESAFSGDTVTADVTFPDGYNIKHIGDGGGISVYNQDGSIPFTYVDGKITFTMP